MGAMPYDHLWQLVLSQVRNRVNDVIFDSIFRAISLDGFKDGKLVLLAQSQSVVLALETQHRWLLEAIILEVSGRDIPYVVQLETVSERRLVVPANRSMEGACIGLNPTITFDTLVRSEFNEDAYGYARLIAEKPKACWSPLYLYSEMPLGKTSLLQAIGNEVARTRPDLRVLYCTAEYFANCFLASLKAYKSGDGDAMKQFRQKFRKLDVWLLDEVNFLEKMVGKETEEEFYHTIAEMDYSQVVVAGVTPPAEIGFSETRLVSRLEKGIVQRIELPLHEARISVVEAWCRAEGIELLPKIVSYMTELVKDDLMELHGCSKQLCARVALMGPLSFTEARELLLDYSTTVERSLVTPEMVFRAVQDYFNCAKPNHETWPNEARHVCIYLLKSLCKMNFTVIADILERENSTIGVSYRKTCQRMKDDRSFGDDIAKLVTIITRRRRA